jgi:hypothetical protein
VQVAVNEGWHDELIPYIEKFGDELAGDIADDAQRFAPYDTGNLESKIVHYRPGKRLRWRIHSKAKYSSGVELGTRSHLILPKRKKALYWPGADHPFLRPALTKARG